MYKNPYRDFDPDDACNHNRTECGFMDAGFCELDGEPCLNLTEEEHEELTERRAS